MIALRQGDLVPGSGTQVLVLPVANFGLFVML